MEENLPSAPPLMHQSLAFESFYSTWRLLDDRIDFKTISEYTLPWIVNGAFACEIGMKYILSRNGISISKVHLLHVLFSHLPSNDKAAIWDRLKDSNNYQDDYISNSILLISNVFNNFRYSYEHTLVIDMDFAANFFNAVYEQVRSYPRVTVVYAGDVTDPILKETVDRQMEQTACTLMKESEKYGEGK